MGLTWYGCQFCSRYFSLLQGQEWLLSIYRTEGYVPVCENAEKKVEWTESKDRKKIVVVSPSLDNVRASPWLPANNY